MLYLPLLDVFFNYQAEVVGRKQFNIVQGTLIEENISKKSTAGKWEKSQEESSEVLIIPS